MKFNIFSELSYEVFSATTFVFNIQAARSASQEIIEESLIVTPGCHYEEFSIDNVDARFIRLEADKGTCIKLSYSAVAEVKYKIIQNPDHLPKISILELDAKVLPYLFSSRHCQSDKLRKLASKEFGHLDTEYEKVHAINDWIYNQIDYISGATDSSTSACDTLIQREGVCKDFAHLGIALCRALDIPARYFTGYAFNLAPPDFHACFEAYIGGHWLFFDPTKLVPVNGLVRIANCKDAGDAAVASFFGNTNCTYINVFCGITDTAFEPFITADGIREAISYQ